jgi:uncharacterized protein (TIGR03083 family)
VERGSNAKEAIGALRRAHDELVTFVGTLGPEDLEKQSAASEWTVAQVLSHLGSASELGLATLASGKADRDAGPAVWDRWNAMSPSEQATNFISAGERLVEALEALDDDALATRRIDLGFLPAPVEIGFVVKLRLSEVGLHGWDVNVAFDPTATVVEYVVPFVLDNLPTFAGFFAKPTGKSGQVALETTSPTRSYVLELRDDGATLAEGSDGAADTRVALPAEALLRLTAGRLGPDHTPPSVKVDGELSLDDLRRLFPGY